MKKNYQNRNITISAIIPTYNRDKIISRAIESVLIQKYKPIEIIVVDDGSNDNTKKALEVYKKQIKYIYQNNLGPSQARNKGINVAIGDWVAFLDSDDYWHNNYLEEMVSVMLKTSGKANLYFSNIERTNEENNELLWDLCEFEINGDYNLTEDASDWVMMSRQPMMLQSSIIKRKEITKIGCFDKNIRCSEDTHLFLRIGIGKPACAVNICCVKMTDDAHPNSRATNIYGGNTLEYWIESERLYKEIIEKQTLKRAYKCKIKKRIAFAHLQISKKLLKNKKIIDIKDSTEHFLRAITTDPAFLFRKMLRYSKRIF